MATKYYLMVKRKGAKRWLGAIPARKGATMAQLKKSIIRGSKSFQYKIVTSSQLKRYILTLKPKGKPIKRRARRRKVRRKARRMAKRRVKRRPMRRRKPMRRRRRRVVRRRRRRR